MLRFILSSLLIIVFSHTTLVSCKGIVEAFVGDIDNIPSGKDEEFSFLPFEPTQGQINKLHANNPDDRLTVTVNGQSMTFQNRYDYRKVYINTNPEDASKITAKQNEKGWSGDIIVGFENSANSLPENQKWRSQFKTDPRNGNSIGTRGAFPEISFGVYFFGSSAGMSDSQKDSLISKMIRQYKTSTICYYENPIRPTSNLQSIIDKDENNLGSKLNEAAPDNRVVNPIESQGFHRGEETINGQQKLKNYVNRNNGQPNNFYLQHPNQIIHVVGPNNFECPFHSFCNGQIQSGKTHRVLTIKADLEALKHEWAHDWAFLDYNHKNQDTNEFCMSPSQGNGIFTNGAGSGSTTKSVDGGVAITDEDILAQAATYKTPEEGLSQLLEQGLKVAVEDKKSAKSAAREAAKTILSNSLSKILRLSSFGVQTDHETTRGERIEAFALYISNYYSEAKDRTIGDVVRRVVTTNLERTIGDHCAPGQEIHTDESCGGCHDFHGPFYDASKFDGELLEKMDVRKENRSKAMSEVKTIQKQMKEGKRVSLFTAMDQIRGTLGDAHFNDFVRETGARMGITIKKGEAGEKQMKLYKTELQSIEDEYQKNLEEAGDDEDAKKKAKVLRDRRIQEMLKGARDSEYVDKKSGTEE